MMFDQLANGERIKRLAKEVEQQIKPIHERIDEVIEANQFRVLQSFQQNQVSDSHFIPSTGYGYDDLGRDTLEKVYADVFGTEACLVRPQIISGTHAIGISLFGVLRLVMTFYTLPVSHTIRLKKSLELEGLALVH